jgi:hypothetical protein
VMIFRESPPQIEANPKLRLSRIAGWPAAVSLGWTLQQLVDRTNMVAQFDCGRWTVQEAMLEALRGVVGPDPEQFDDDERYLAERDRLAMACWNAVVAHLGIATPSALAS